MRRLKNAFAGAVMVITVFPPNGALSAEVKGGFVLCGGLNVKPGKPGKDIMVSASTYKKLQENSIKLPKIKGGVVHGVLPFSSYGGWLKVYGEYNSVMIIDYDLKDVDGKILGKMVRAFKNSNSSLRIFQEYTSGCYLYAEVPLCPSPKGEGSYVLCSDL